MRSQEPIVHPRFHFLPAALRLPLPSALRLPLPAALRLLLPAALLRAAVFPKSQRCPNRRIHTHRLHLLLLHLKPQRFPYRRIHTHHALPQHSV